jgi:hypothetical protein
MTDLAAKAVMTKPMTKREKLMKMPVMLTALMWMYTEIRHLGFRRLDLHVLQMGRCCGMFLL